MKCAATTCVKNKMADSTDQLLDKMQALIGKHRDAPSTPETEAKTDADAAISMDDLRAADPFPVLTDIVRRGDALANTAPAPTSPEAPDSTAEHPPVAPAGALAPAALTSSEQAEQLATAVATHVLGMLDGHLEHTVNTVIAQRLRRVVDETLSTLLTELALDMEAIVREAVSAELARHGIRPADTPETPSNPV